MSNYKDLVSCEHGGPATGVHTAGILLSQLSQHNALYTVLILQIEFGFYQISCLHNFYSFNLANKQISCFSQSKCSGPFMAEEDILYFCDLFGECEIDRTV